MVYGLFTVLDLPPCVISICLSSLSCSLELEDCRDHFLSSAQGSLILEKCSQLIPHALPLILGVSRCKYKDSKEEMSQLF